MTRGPASRREHRTTAPFRAGAESARSYWRGYSAGRSDGPAAPVPAVRVDPARPARPLAAQLVCPPGARPVEQPTGEQILGDLRPMARMLAQAIRDDDQVRIRLYGTALYVVIMAGGEDR